LAQEADVLYAFKAMPTSLEVALRVRESTDQPILLHLDDWDGGYFHDVGALRRLWRGLRSWDDPRSDLRLRLLERRIREVDAVTVSTRALQRRFGGTLVRQGVDTHRWDPARFSRDEARERLGVSPGDPMVLFLGSPRPHKGLTNLAAAGLSSALWFVGATASELREAGVPESLVGSATLRGPVPFAEAAWYLAACDVFVVPQSRTPYSEHQLPAKLLQAMAMGCAIVATDVGDAQELLGGDAPAGIVIPPDDVGALRTAIEALLSDGAQAARLSREARRRSVAELGWKAMAAQVEPLMDEAIRGV
jgi:glycosyltransferase involved in cell wall biosynthesis